MTTNINNSIYIYFLLFGNLLLLFALWIMNKITIIYMLNLTYKYILILIDTFHIYTFINSWYVINSNIC